MAEEEKKEPVEKKKTAVALRYDVDRDKARALGIPINVVFETMQSSFGSLYVNDFSLFGRTYRVSLSSEADFRESPDDMRHIFVRADSGAMVPLSELVTFTRILGPDTVDRFNIFPAAKILGGPAPGYSSGQAIAVMQDVVAKTLSADFTIGWIGSAWSRLRRWPMRRSMAGRKTCAALSALPTPWPAPCAR